MLLAIDTCGAMGGVALGDLSAGSPRTWSRELAGKTYSERLLSSIEELLQEAHIALHAIAGVAVVSGPGSFTGIRIGVSAAKGFAEGLDVGVVTVSRLELLAGKGNGADSVAVLDAGRGEFYAGFYQDGSRQTEALLTRDALVQAVADSRSQVLVCEQQLFTALEEWKPVLVPPPDAIDALRLGAQRFRAGAFADVASFEANYLRRSESEMLARVAEHLAGREAAKSALVR